MIKNGNVSNYKNFISENYKIEDHNKAFSDISIELSVQGYFDKSIDFLKLIENDEPNWCLDESGDASEVFENVLKTNTSENISKQLIRNGHIDKSISVANKIEHLGNKIFLYNDLIDEYLQFSKNKQIFSFDDLKKLVFNKSEIYKYVIHKQLPPNYNQILEQVSFKVCNHIIDLFYLNGYNNSDMKIIENLSFSYESYEDCMPPGFILTKNEELFYLNKGINLAIFSTHFYNLNLKSKSLLFYNKAKNLYNKYKNNNDLHTSDISLLAELSSKLFLLSKNIEPSLSNEYLKSTFTFLSSILDASIDSFNIAHYHICYDSINYDSELDKYSYDCSKDRALNLILNEILNYFLKVNDKINFHKIFLKFYLNEKITKSRSEIFTYYNLDEFYERKRVIEKGEIKIDLNNKQKLIDEVIFEVCLIKCKCLKNLNFQKSSALYMEVLKDLISEASDISDPEIKSSIYLKLSELFLFLTVKEDFFLENLLKTSKCLNNLDFLKLINSINLNKDSLDHNYFISKKYFFLSNFYSSYDISKLFVSTSFETYFKTKEKLSPFNKLFKTELYERLNSLAS